MAHHVLLALFIGRRVPNFENDFQANHAGGLQIMVWMYCWDASTCCSTNESNLF